MVRRRSEKWSGRQQFRVDSRTAIFTSDMLRTVYAWELAEVASSRELELGAHNSPPGDDDDGFLTSIARANAAAPGAALTEELPISDEGDAAAVVARACSLTLCSRADCYATAVLTPNLACVWRCAADAAVVGLARELHWPRVKMLLAGLREPPPPPAAPATTPTTAAAGTPGVTTSSTTDADADATAAATAAASLAIVDEEASESADCCCACRMDM